MPQTQIKKTMVNSGGSTKPKPRKVAVRKGENEWRSQLLEPTSDAERLFFDCDFMNRANDNLNSLVKPDNERLTVIR